MSERSVEDSVDDRSSAVHAPNPPASPVLKWGATSLRFDDADPSTVPPEAPAPQPLLSVTEPGLLVVGKLNVLAEASQLVLQVQQQLGDLDRREQQLSQRLAEFDQSERRFRLWVNETEADLQERKSSILNQESALAQRLIDHDRQLREFEERYEQFELDREELDQQRSALQHDLQAERDAVDLQQAKVQELGDALLEQQRTLQDRMSQQLQREREQLWESLSAEWTEHRVKFENEQAEFFKDRTLLENRIRFQQDHLEKTRAELELEQQTALFEQQLRRQKLEEGEQQLQRRKVQLDRYRAALEQMDRALERERDLHSRLKAALSSSAEQERQHHLAERQAWDDERQQQQAELRRQQELLLTHTEQLETRRLRMENLRREVEETNHTTIELRLAVEEIWAQIQQSSGAATAHQQVEQARLAVTRDYEQWHARLGEQRQELLDAERNLEQQRQAFQEERRMLTHWIVERDQQLRDNEQQQQRVAAEQQTQDQALQSLQERWLSEKSAAEQVIRGLLHDLIDQTADLPQPDGSALAHD